jgi:hypothetical protein
MVLYSVLITTLSFSLASAITSSKYSGSQSDFVPDSTRTASSGSAAMTSL